MRWVCCNSLTLLFSAVKVTPEDLPHLLHQTVSRLRNKVFRKLTAGQLAIFRHQHTALDLEVFYVSTALLEETWGRASQFQLTALLYPDAENSRERYGCLLNAVGTGSTHFRATAQVGCTPRSPRSVDQGKGHYSFSTNGILDGKGTMGDPNKAAWCSVLFSAKKIAGRAVPFLFAPPCTGLRNY
jgi:hypothetical protein